MASAPAGTPVNGNTTASTNGNTNAAITNSNNNGGGRVYFKIPQSVSELHHYVPSTLEQFISLSAFSRAALTSLKVDIETANQKKRRTKSYVQRDKADLTKLHDGTLKEIFSYLHGHDLICLALTKKSIAHKVLGLARPFVDDNPTVIELDLVTDTIRLWDCTSYYNTPLSFMYYNPVEVKRLPRRVSYLSTVRQLMVQLHSWMPRRPAHRYCWICNKYTRVRREGDRSSGPGSSGWYFLSDHYRRVLSTLVPSCQKHTLYGVYPENVYCHASCGERSELRTFAETTPGVSLDAYFGDNDGPPNGVAIGTVKECRGRCPGNQPYNAHFPV